MPQELTSQQQEVVNRLRSFSEMLSLYLKRIEESVTEDYDPLFLTPGGYLDAAVESAKHVAWEIAKNQIDVPAINP